MVKLYIKKWGGGVLKKRRVYPKIEEKDKIRKLSKEVNPYGKNRQDKFTEVPGRNQQV